MKKIAKNDQNKKMSTPEEAPKVQVLEPSQEIWANIKDKNMDIFAMETKVHNYFEFMNFDPNKCYLLSKATAALPALETALGSDYVCSLQEKYILVEKNMPFDSEEQEEIKTPNRKIGLKGQTTNREQRPDKKAQFEEIADHAFQKIEDYKTRMWDLSVKYKSFIESTILPDNKGPIADNIEKEVLDQLIKLAMAMNEDPAQDEGIGGTALCMLLFKCMLVQRNIINKLNFRVSQLEKK